MLHKTAGLVLRTVKYGESSVVVRLFTELFGVQSYMVNGVRKAGTKKAGASLLQPAHLLDLVVYQREGSQLQRISDFRYAYLYRSLYGDVVKNAIALYLVELLDKTLRQPESHPELFHLVSDALRWMDQQERGTANLPLYLSLRLAALLGFGFYGRWSHERPYLDLGEGLFVAERPHHPHWLDEASARAADQLMQAPGFAEMQALPLDKVGRQRLLAACQDYYRLHLSGFTGLRSPEVLAAVLE